MIYESLTVLVVLALLGLIGIGPALQLLPVQPRQKGFALALSPILGFVILEILGLPLVRYLAPVRDWALPLTVILVGISATLAVLWWRKNPTAHGLEIEWRTLGLPTLFFFGCLVILVSPMAIMGLQYSIFRSNSSDAFTYISLAETMRDAPWNLVVSGIRLTSENAAAVQQLASASPSALLTARMVGLPLQLNNMVTLAWYAQLTGLPVYAVYFPFHILAFLNAFLLSAVFGDVLGLGRWLKYLAAAAVALGFWARFVLESDAGFEIISIPLLLLVTLAWIQQEQFAPTQLFSRPRVFLALAITGLAVNYLILAGFVAVAFLIFYVINLLQRRRSFRALLYEGITAVLVLLFLTLTGQVDMQLLSFLFGMVNIERQRAFEATVWGIWQASGPSAVWGMGMETLLGAQRALIRLPLLVITNLYALGLTALLLFAGWVSLFKSRRVAEQILFSLLLAALILFIWSFTGGNLRAAGKAFTYVYPYVVLGLAVATLQVGSFKPWVQKAAIGTVMAWCVIQIGLGALLPHTNVFSRVFNYARRAEAYDLSAITRVLDQNPPNLVLVSVPRTTSWEFPFYATLVFGRYPAHFAGGLVIDNSTNVRNLWVDDLDTAADFAVLSKSESAILAARLGDKLAETQDLELYRLNPETFELLREREQALRALDESKPIFQQSLPLQFGVR